VGFVPEHVHRALTTALRPLFWPPVVVVVLAALVAVDVRVFLGGLDLVDAARQIVVQPQLLLVVTALTILGAAFHEIGHATAARYGGATPGAMGAGIYMVWPVFFTDVTDSYRLDRRGRLRTDLGGIYFNVLYTVLAAAAFLATDYQPLAVVVLLVQLETLQQFLPFVRLDGYYVISDVVGVPNLFSYLQPVVRSLTGRGGMAARHRAQARLAELRPWARRVITAWVCLTVPILAANLVVFLVIGPRLAGTAWASARLAIGEARQALAGGDAVAWLNAMVALLLLALPVAGAVWLLLDMLWRMARAARRSWSTRPVLSGGVMILLGATLALLLTVVWRPSFTTAYQEASRLAAVDSATSQPDETAAGSFAGQPHPTVAQPPADAGPSSAGAVTADTAGTEMTLPGPRAGPTAAPAALAPLPVAPPAGVGATAACPSAADAHATTAGAPRSWMAELRCAVTSGRASPTG
jgi:hypothetical protein